MPKDDMHDDNELRRQVQAAADEASDLDERRSGYAIIVIDPLADVPMYVVGPFDNAATALDYAGGTNFMIEPEGGTSVVPIERPVVI